MTDLAETLAAEAAVSLRAPSAKETPEFAFAVDPGGVHVGFSLWSRRPGHQGWALSFAEEWTRQEYADWISDAPTRARFSYAAIETFRLGSPEEALAQIGSDFPTAELIGMTKQGCRMSGIPLLLTDRTKKKSALSRIKARNGGKVPGVGRHAKDAVSIWISATALPIDTFSF